ncbi:MAG: proteasome accessory factor PafA2 family protein, partial [Candidatus Aenigmarchaeota archaeon]|nr:proteasome accessory factor PafA2 family protein [Candidatus Aenigmarchaeota archaeon]
MKNRIAGIETEYGIFPIPQNDYDLYIPFEAGKRRHIEFACNGSRVYEDTGSHPEYAAPECIGPSDAALYDAAGAVLMHRLFAGSEYELHRLNADEYGNTFGSHENYSVQTGLMREPGISLLVPMVLPFLVTRQIFAGTGYYYDGKFMISQRAGFINSMVGTSTTNSRDRAIVNTKYEHHSSTCDRFHLI